VTYKVLIVDDSKLARMSVTKVLRALNSDWTPIEAANAEEAVGLMSSERPDIAMVDFNMPGKDGLTLAADLRSLRPDMPVAVVSANIQREIVERATSVGATFLAKPVTEQSLTAFIATATTQLKGA
jgi:CheY-like chemotaxis protein